jgi:hypothetical protein
MSYKINDNILQTGQLLKPDIEETIFVLSDHVLKLYFDGIKSSFIRVFCYSTYVVQKIKKSTIKLEAEVHKYKLKFSDFKIEAWLA